MQVRIAADRAGRVRTGRSRRVSPWEVAFLDSTTRANVVADMYGNHERCGVEVSLQSAEACYALRPKRVADRISPRPLLIVHGGRNAPRLIDEARSLSAHARAP